MKIAKAPFESSRRALSGGVTRERRASRRSLPPSRTITAGKVIRRNQVTQFTDTEKYRSTCTKPPLTSGSSFFTLLAYRIQVGAEPAFREAHGVQPNLRLTCVACRPEGARQNHSIKENAFRQSFPNPMRAEGWDPMRKQIHVTTLCFCNHSHTHTAANRGTGPASVIWQAIRLLSTQKEILRVVSSRLNRQRHGSRGVKKPQTFFGAIRLRFEATYSQLLPAGQRGKHTFLQKRLSL